MNAKKIISLLLISLLFSSAFLLSSCGDKKEPAENQQNNESIAQTTSQETKSEADQKSVYNPGFEKADMGGYVFKIGTRDDSTHGYPFHTRDLFAEGETGDLINDAVYRRNAAVEEKFNCKIEMEAFPETADEYKVNSIVDKSVKAGDYSFDLVMTHMIKGATTSATGNYYNLFDFPNIDLTKPYWSKNVTDNMSIGSKLYIGLSDLSFSTNENIYCMFFNKELIKNNSLEDPYTLVNSNNWTFDKFNEIIRNGKADLDGDGTMTVDDQYGYVSSNALNFLWSGGSHIMKKDDNGIPALDMMTEKTIAIFDKAYEITNNDYTFSNKEWFEKTGIEIFTAGRGIFHSSQLIRVNDLRAVDFDFGIVPYPKFDSAQEKYYSYIDGHASCMGIPQNLPNPEYTGKIIEELSYLSYRDILPTYYDVVLNIKLVRDEESVKSLQTLFDSKTIDFGYAYGDWNLWFLFIDCIATKNKDLASKYEKSLPAFEKSMNNIVESFNG